MFLIPYLIRFWKPLALIALAVAAWAYINSVDQAGYDRGYAARRSEEIIDTQRRVDAANKADDEAKRCAADPVCRSKPDPYERKDDEP